MEIEAETEILSKYQQGMIEMKHTVTEIKGGFGEFFSRWDIPEGKKPHQLEDESIEMFQTERKRKKLKKGRNPPPFFSFTLPVLLSIFYNFILFILFTTKAKRTFLNCL